MSISEPVIEMARRIKDPEITSYTMNGYVFYVSFGMDGGTIILAPKLINNITDYSDQQWMTDEEVKYLCDIFYARYAQDQKQLRELELIKGRENWKALLGIN